MTIVIIIAGVIIFVIGGIRLLIEAFRQSIFWGLACLFINPACVVFTIFFWNTAKKPFLTQLFGFSLILIGTYLGDNYRF